MSAYIRSLNDEIARDAVEREAEREQAKAEVKKERLIPLEHRLAKLLDQFPDAQKAEGLSILEDLQPRLKGRQRGNASPSELSRALFKLGWTRVRHRPIIGPSFVSWYPPGADTGSPKNPPRKKA